MTAVRTAFQLIRDDASWCRDVSYRGGWNRDGSNHDAPHRDESSRVELPHDAPRARRERNLLERHYPFEPHFVSRNQREPPSQPRDATRPLSSRNLRPLASPNQRPLASPNQRPPGD
jgi:hypothetical protein